MKRLGLVGAGLIGRRHAESIALSPTATLAAVADPVGGEDIAAAHGAAHFRDLGAMLAAGGLDGVILATPNALHAEGALACIAAGLPVLVEKPIAHALEAARAMVEAAEAAGVPLAVGHHRRCNPLIAAAKAQIEAGRLGRITAAQGICWFRKPDAYFEADWRRAPGAGPVYINLIHDVDLLQHLVGPVVEVQALESSAARGFAVEDTAAILLRFANGALGTFTLSDAVQAPWSWELTARENPAYPATAESCARIGGTEGSLSLPDVTFWSHRGTGWWDPIAAERTPYPFDEPLVRQIAMFADVIDGGPPACSGREGLAALAVIEAVKQAARTGAPVRV